MRTSPQLTCLPPMGMHADNSWWGAPRYSGARRRCRVPEIKGVRTMANRLKKSIEKYITLRKWMRWLRRGSNPGPRSKDPARDHCATEPDALCADIQLKFNYINTKCRAAFQNVTPAISKLPRTNTCVWTYGGIKYGRCYIAQTMNIAMPFLFSYHHFTVSRAPVQRSWIL